jgi:hypothetical protein
MKKVKKIKQSKTTEGKLKFYKKALVDEEWLMQSEKMKSYDEIVNSPGVINFLRERGLIK